MENSEIINKLTSISKIIFNDDSIILTNNTTAKDIEDWDSLTHMLFISKIEKEFSIKFKMKEIFKMKNIGDMVEIILTKF